jgi:hypothetical protein
MATESRKNPWFSVTESEFDPTAPLKSDTLIAKTKKRERKKRQKVSRQEVAGCRGLA